MRLAALSLIVLGACTRDPVESVCPPINPGALVITEIRGAQTLDTDTLGEWIEVYNDSSSPIDLLGISLRFRRLDGSSEIKTLIRSTTNLAPGDYAVLGNFPSAMKPGHVDYAFAEDFHEDFYSSAALELLSCGERIDLVKYDSLPLEGTYSLGGQPTAERNDLPAEWCFDGTMVASNYPGTPQTPNIACP